MILCPSCQSIKIVKNSKTYYGKQNHKCKDCGRQFVLNNKHHIPEDQREMIRKALNERISLLGICRVFNVSLPWLLSFAESVWEAVPINIGLNDRWLKQLRQQFPIWLKPEPQKAQRAQKSRKDEEKSRRDFSSSRLLCPFVPFVVKKQVAFAFVKIK